MSEQTPMLVAEDLARYFDVSRPLLQRLLSGEGRRTLKAVDGISFDIPKGCAFNPRCPHVFERCRRERPELLETGTTLATCWLYDPASEKQVPELLKDD